MLQSKISQSSASRVWLSMLALFNLLAVVSVRVTRELLREFACGNEWGGRCIVVVLSSACSSSGTQAWKCHVAMKL